MMHNLHGVARALGGVIVGRASVLAPGPGHSPTDRSLSVKLDPVAPDGFVVHSFAGDPVIDCRDHVRAALGLRLSNRTHTLPSAALSGIATVVHSSDSSAFALRLWREASDPRGTVVERYLSSRGLTLPDDVADSVVRFHPRLKYNGKSVGGMVTLFRDITTNAPCGIQRTFLDPAGVKIKRAMLGRAKHAAIKTDADENVTVGLTIGEGFESSLAARLAGFRPVWALGSAGAIADFPVLPGIDAITVLGEVGDRGANHRATQTCVERWREAGQEAFIATPLVGKDLNDAWREVAT
jgi:putative DNA primase/helicase